MRVTDAHNSQEPLRRAGAPGRRAPWGGARLTCVQHSLLGSVVTGPGSLGSGPVPLPLGCGNALHLGVCAIRSVCVWCV